LIALEERQSLIGGGKGENHPLVKAVDGRIGELKQALLNEIANIKGAVQRDLAIIEHEEAGEAALYNEAKKRAIELNMQETEYRRLDRTRDQDEKLYTQLVERMKDTDLARRMHSNNVRPVDPATDPKGPIKPRPMVNVMIAVAIGLLIGVVLAWLREQLDNSVKVPEDVEQKLGMTFIGLLPEHDENGELKSSGYGGRKRSKRRRRRVSTLAPELVVHEHPLSAIGEAARSVRTNLIFMNPDSPFRRILVTSAAPAEGKTTVACSIAIAMAQGGQRTCIVDCDLRRPRLHRIFDRAGDMGITNLLVGDASLDDVAKPTVVKNLWSIPAGPTPPNPADMLHSERFRKFLAELSERFDRIIIDSPPVVAVTDAAIVSTLVDTAVFVIRAFKTSLTLSRQGMRALADVDASIAGAVLNAVDFNKLEYNYYYGYGYYHQRQKYAYGPKPPPPPSDDDESEESSSAPN
jgi:capsular exopolysaccharide synthesis family protein